MVNNKLKEIARQMIDFHKKSFGKNFSEMVMLQEKVESRLKAYVEKTLEMSKESRKVIDQCNNDYKKSREDFRKAINKVYSEIESFLGDDGVATTQDQTEKIFATLMPQDVKKVINKLAATYDDGLDKFKEYVDESIQQLKDFFSTVEKPRKKTKQQK